MRKGVAVKLITLASGNRAKTLINEVEGIGGIGRAFVSARQGT